MAELVLRGIDKSYGGAAILRGIDFDVADGEFMTIVGPSGCGKSTLLRIVAGLESHQGGEVLIGSQCMNDRMPSQRDVAMVFQSYALYPHMTVFDNIATPLRFRRLSALQRLPLIGRWMPGAREARAGIEKEVCAAAKLLDIADLLDRKPSQLSGGQRQRVALGRSIVRRPKLYLMDEPLSNLDATLRSAMRSELTELHGRIRTTFLYVTHDQAEAMTMSDRVAVMFAGRFEQIDTPERIYSDPATLAVAEFIGSPRINKVPVVVAARSLRVGERGLELTTDSGKEGTYHVCFRPEAASLGRRQITWKGTVSFIEDMGADLHVHVAVPGIPDKVIVRARRAGGIKLATGDRVQVGIEPGDLLLFDPDGQRAGVRQTEHACVA